VQWKRFRCRAIRGAAAAVAVWAFTGGQPPAAAEDAQSPPFVGLDQLLKLPDSLEFEPTTRGGSTKAEWRARFQTAREELAAARAALSKTREKLAKVSGSTSAWKVAPPGLGGIEPSSAKDTPLDYGLSNEKRRNRAEVERAERRLAELEIGANLAAVPEDWRGAEPTEAPSASQEPE